MSRKFIFGVVGLCCVLFFWGASLYFSTKSIPPKLEREKPSELFVLQSLTLNGVECPISKSETLTLPKVVDLKFVFRFGWLSDVGPREVGTVKVVHGLDGVIVQSASGTIKNYGKKSSTMSVQFRIPADTKLGASMLVIRTIKMPLAEVRCNIVE